MTAYTVSLSLTTNDDCESPDEAVQYFVGQIQEGVQLTVVNDDTGESTEEFSR